MDALVTVSRTSRDFLSAKFRLPPDRFTVCPNAVASAYRRLPDNEIGAPARLGIRPPYVLHLSNFSERKNPIAILKGFAGFHGSTEGRDTTLVLAGNRCKNPRTLTLAAELCIQDRVIFPGFVCEQDAIELLSCASCFLFPSLAEVLPSQGRCGASFVTAT